MDSWLRKAEGLFEVVDQRAKLVVSEFSDEQADSQARVSNRQRSQAKKAKSKTKAGKIAVGGETPKQSDSTEEQSPNTLTSQANITPVKVGDALLNENDLASPGKSLVQRSNKNQLNYNDDFPTLDVPVTETSANGASSSEADHLEIPASIIDAEFALSASNNELHNVINLEVHEENSLLLSSVGGEVLGENHPADVGLGSKLDDGDVPQKIDQENSQSSSSDSPSSSEIEFKAVNTKNYSVASQKKQQEHKTNASSQTVQEQLDEAQGLLKTAISTGQSKEARMARVCAGLSARLREKKSENEQLEELLVAERELSKSYEAHIKQLQQDLSASKNEVTRIELNMAEALATKNAEIKALLSSMDALKKQAALSEGNLASLQANMESIMRNRELAETRMMQALPEELASAERRAEEDRAAHNATKMAAMEREVELEHRAMEGSTALATIQRVADERTAKTTELEQKVALLEVECANLNQELQVMESCAPRGQKKSPEEANQVIQLQQAWQEEVERARQSQRDAESKLCSMEAEVQKMRVEMSAMKRDAEHYSRQEHMELEKRYRELTDLLYYKQTQLETMASEKAAAEFQLEKELKRLQEAQVEVERSRIPQRASSAWEEDTEMKALELLPFHHRQMAAASRQLQKAAKLLDSGAVRATRFLWQYPTARVILLFYLVFVHIFLMYLLHRLQEQADEFSAREVAESMGLR